MDDLIHIENLRFGYQADEEWLFDGLCFRIPRGRITAIMGPSGTGKTTLLRLIGGQLKPYSGNIAFDGLNLGKINHGAICQLRRKIGLLFQSGALFTSLNVFENVAFPLREHTSLPEALIRNLVLIKLELVGLRGARDLMPSQLSGGMARRVALARALIMDPLLMMYDEPFTGLDPISKGVIVKLISELHHALGMTSIIVSHDVNEALTIADYFYVLAKGKIIGEGDPKTLLKDGNPGVLQFMHGLPDGVVPFHYKAAKYSEDLLAHD